MTPMPAYVAARRGGGLAGRNDDRQCAALDLRSSLTPAKLPPRLAATYAGIGVIVALHWLGLLRFDQIVERVGGRHLHGAGAALIAFLEPPAGPAPIRSAGAFLWSDGDSRRSLVVGGTPAAMRTGLAVGVLSAFLAAIFGTLTNASSSTAARLP